MSSTPSRHSLYVKDGKFKYVNNFIGLKEQILVADQDLPKGDCIVGVSFEMEAMAAMKRD